MCKRIDRRQKTVGLGQFPRAAFADAAAPDRVLSLEYQKRKD